MDPRLHHPAGSDSGSPIPHRTLGACPSALELAAWCDDRAGDDRAGEAALLDIHISQCPTCCALIERLSLDLSESLRAEEPLTPQMVSRAVALVPSRMRFALPARLAACGVAAAAVLGIAWAGAAIGLALGHSVSTDSTAPTTDVLSFGLIGNDTGADDGSDLLDLTTSTPTAGAES